MLIEFKVENFFSFKDEQVFTMVASSDDELLENTLLSPAFPKYKLLKSAAIFGANASGKTNLIKAFSFVKWFVRNSHKRDIDAKIPLQPFLLSDSTINTPTSFEVVFIQKNIRYQYGFVVNSERVLEEWLFAYPHGRPQTWFRRKDKDEPGDFKTEDNSWNFGTYLKGDNRTFASSTRPNVLFLSKAVDSNHKQLRDILEWFSSCLSAFVAAQDIPPTLTASAIEEDPSLKEKVLNFLRWCDIAIIDFDIKKEDFLTPPSETASQEERVLYQALKTSNPIRWQISLTHQTDDLTSSRNLRLQDESIGTTRLFALAAIIIRALETGRVLVMDELDSSLHPLLVRNILKLFQNPDTNKAGAQLIFNTHDVTLLDKKLFRRDQIWLVEKDRLNVSHLYPLSDIDVRKDEPFEKNYLQGRYGGIPMFAENFYTFAQVEPKE